MTYVLRPETADKQAHVHLNKLISPVSGWKELLRQCKKSASTFDTGIYFPVLKTKAARSSKTSVNTELHGVVSEKNLRSHRVQNLFSKKASFDLGRKIMVYRLAAKTTANVLSQFYCEQDSCCFNEIVLIQKSIKSLQHIALLFSSPVKVSINIMWFLQFLQVRWEQKTS
jgi:hypothetical protein